jgi:Spy/CpxP family protein refolding chaperone
MLGLSTDQEAEIQAIFDEMQAQARSLGKTIVELERDLDRSFAEGLITERRLDQRLEAIAKQRVRLRATHLRAHIRLLPVLTESQREQYEQARGYKG